jgi:hypothetical protein
MACPVQKLDVEIFEGVPFSNAIPTRKAIMKTTQKPLSKTVQQRQLRRMRPRHYEILARYMEGHTPQGISSEMQIGQQRLSVIVNSPIFQKEFRRLRQAEEKKLLVDHIVENMSRRASIPPAEARHSKVASTPLQPPFVAESVNREHTQANLGEEIIFQLSRSETSEKATPTETPAATPASDSAPIVSTAPAPAKPPTAQAVAPSRPTFVQAAKFYSEVLQDSVWLVLLYPGERLAYFEAKELLKLTRGTAWNTYPQGCVPCDGHGYSAEEISE